MSSSSDKSANIPISISFFFSLLRVTSEFPKIIDKLTFGYFEENFFIKVIKCTGATVPILSDPEVKFLAEPNKFIACSWISLIPLVMSKSFLPYSVRFIPFPFRRNNFILNLASASRICSDIAD